MWTHCFLFCLILNILNWMDTVWFKLFVTIVTAEISFSTLFKDYVFFQCVCIQKKQYIQIPDKMSLSARFKLQLIHFPKMKFKCSLESPTLVTHNFVQLYLLTCWVMILATMLNTNWLGTFFWALKANNSLSTIVSTYLNLKV